MIDLNASPEPLSTVIDNDAPIPGAADYRPEPEAPEPAPEKAMSLEDAIKQAAAETKEKADKPEVEAKAKPEPKAKVEPKVEKPQPDRGDGGKFKAREPQAAQTQEPSEAIANEAETGQGDDTNRPSEGREDKPPARFLPRAKEAWASTNPDIRGEVRRMEAEYEKGIQEHKASHEFRKELREFEEMAKGHGTTVKDALTNYVAIDNLLKSDPVAGIERVLKSIGISPQQYAQHVLNAPQQPPADPKVSQLEQTVRQLQQQLQGVTQHTEKSQQEAQLQQVHSTIIDPFRASLGDNDRYEELEEDIAFFLNSDRIPSTLSAQQRLATAYDMAERINPAGYAPQNAERLKPAPDDRPLNPAGRKSVKGSLSYGAEVPRKSAKLSLDEAIKMAARSVNG